MPTAGLLWLALLGLEFHRAMAWEARPGTQGTPRPSLVTSRANLRTYKLVMVAHPLCPCTAASLRQLALISERHPHLDVCIYFTQISSRDVQKSTNVSIANSIPLAKISYVSENDQRANIGAATSGQVFLFNPDGKQVFNGGLTDGRGVEGDSKGTRSIDQILDGHLLTATTGVYGCALATPRDRT